MVASFIGTTEKRSATSVTSVTNSLCRSYYDQFAADFRNELAGFGAPEQIQSVLLHPIVPSWTRSLRRRVL